MRGSGPPPTIPNLHPTPATPIKPGRGSPAFLPSTPLFSEPWWEINGNYLDSHPAASSVFRCLMLTDMELVALLPWKPSGEVAANGFPLEAAEQGRRNAHVTNGVQFMIQVAYLLLLGDMDWATLPSMVLSVAGFMFRVFVWKDQRMARQNQGEQPRLFMHVRPLPATRRRTRT